MRSYFVLIAASFFSLVGAIHAASSAPAVDSHKAYDQKMRDCRKSVSEKGLSSEAQRSAVAACMKESAPKTQ